MYKIGLLQVHGYSYVDSIEDSTLYEPLSNKFISASDFKHVIFSLNHSGLPVSPLLSDLHGMLEMLCVRLRIKN